MNYNTTTSFDGKCGDIESSGYEAKDLGTENEQLDDGINSSDGKHVSQNSSTEDKEKTFDKGSTVRNLNQVDIKMLESLKNQIKTIREIMMDRTRMHRDDIDKKYSKFADMNQKTYINVFDNKVDVIKLEQMYDRYAAIYNTEQGIDKKFETDLKFGEYIAEEFLYKNGIQRPSDKDMARARKIVRKKRDEPIKGVANKEEMTRLNFE
jgi:hypothetical protein